MSAQGLGSAEARARLAAEGPNALPAAGKRRTLAIALEVLREPMFLLLIIGAGIYLLLGDAREAAVLGASVVVVVMITILQERKTERALDALRDLSSPRALVVRDGTVQRIAGAEVVRGDLLLLSEGDRVPADAVLVETNDLLLDESLLTGESLPVDKRVGGEGVDARGGRVYSGTLVVKGQGRALAEATGPNTEFGKIGGHLATLEVEKTTLQRETARAVKWIAIGGLVLCVAVALLYYATRGDFLAGVLAGVTLAMAILPEEFPVVLTVFLALGAWRISRHGVLTRRMPAVEMLGAATVLCVDKTGTLTENRMALAEVFAAGGWHLMAGARQEATLAIIEAAALASELEPFDPMERAIVRDAEAAAPQLAARRREWVLEADWPMTPDFLAVCHGWRDPQGAAQLAVKGAPETVLALCGMAGRERDEALAEVHVAAERGLRILAVAVAEVQGEWPAHPREVQLRWLGFVALADPLRASVPAAVAECRRAGIRVIMITGDFPGTALAIAARAGIEVAAGVVTGEALQAMDDAALAGVSRTACVFARITPEQKLRLVRALKANGEVAAMTGDGVNDAPALKAAHIGIAMGRRGTDVAREASALVLMEDDFGSIVDTVRLGRRIYENIRNAMRYLIAAHVPTVGLSFLPLVFGWPLLLFPVHIVFLEFVIDPACAIAFEAEPNEEGAMERPPRAPDAPLFDAHMVLTGVGLGMSVLVMVFAATWWAVHAGRTEAQVRALGFSAIVFGNLALILANRSGSRSILHTLRRQNAALWWIVGGALAALGCAVYIPAVADLFRFAPLAAVDAVLAAVAGCAGVVWYEIAKLVRVRAIR